MVVWIASFFEIGWGEYMIGVYSSRDKAAEAMEKHRKNNGYSPIEDWDKGTEGNETYYLDEGQYELYPYNLDEMPL